MTEDFLFSPSERQQEGGEVEFGGLFIGAVMLMVVVEEGAVGSRDQMKLRTELFSSGKYDKSIRPVKNVSKATVVEMQFFVARVLDVDERLETFKINAWLTMRWFDDYLTWDPERYNNVDNFKISRDKIWMPDLWLYNNAGSRYEDYAANSICSVYHTGKVIWQSPTIIKTHCTMDVTNFPFDVQTCNVIFGPWQHGVSEILLNGTGSADRYLRSSGGWQITLFRATANQQEYTIYDGDDPIAFSYVEYSVFLRRIPTYFVFYLIMPCTLISTTTFLSFFLPPESGEKVSLGITVLLSLTVFLLIVAELLPPSGAVPIIAIYYAATMVMVSLSLAMSVVVLNLHHRGPETSAVPQWLRKIVLGRVGKVVLMRRSSFNQENYYRSRKTQPCQGARLLNHYEMDSYDGNYWEENRDGVDVSANGGNVRLERSDRLSRPCSGPTTSHSKNSNNSVRVREINLLRKIHEDFRYMRETQKQKKLEEKCHNEWKQVALVVDRIFMFIYLVGMISTILIIVAQVHG
ncbi:neuronal acetylcholine receptor subunit alpha-9-like [Diadema antillarum]|uniref:neuronal acetylcholine receptor subunit alpha-9-like n=1 Tax=Diadema antillarum TaxID=105358 RepID=UPI003A8A191C